VTEGAESISGKRGLPALLDGLEGAIAQLGDTRFPLPPLRGKLLRPLVALLAVPERDRSALPLGFWAGALAIQMVHEASLLHDDVVDGSTHRRGEPSMAASRGPAAALIQGDHLLTGAYRLVAEKAHPAFFPLFCRAVEGTVAGESRQGFSLGEILDESEYRAIVCAKSGELFGAALALAALTQGRDAERAFQAGCRVGTLYQMVDDFLDLCPAADLGKSPFQDYEQRKWTLPLGLAGVNTWDLSEGELRERLFATAGGSASQAGMTRALSALRAERAASESALRDVFGDVHDLALLLEGWIDRAATIMECECNAASTGSAPAAPGTPPSPRDAIVAEAAPLVGPVEWLAYFGAHGTSFRFAARLFPPGPRDVVAGIYAFCRFTDDLVDRREDLPPEEREVLLDAWLELAREAWETGRSDVPLLAAVLGDSAQHGVPFRYAAELIEGVRMDLTPRSYATMEELRVYSYRVASVVGLWLTERFGNHDPEVLERAAALGHGMQLTNILRDVGEDLRRGRCYLPLDRMSAHGVTREAMESVALGEGREGSARAGLPEGFVPLLSELLEHAEADYRVSFPGIAALPDFFQSPVAVASHVYMGIHGAIRRNGHDTLTRRAWTTLPRKGVLAASALLELRRLRRRTGAFSPLLSPPVWASAKGGEEVA